MKDHEIAQLVSELTHAAYQHADTQQMRNRIRSIVLAHVPRTYSTNIEKKAVSHELEPYYADWLLRIENEGLHEKEDIAGRFAEYSLALDNLVSIAAFDRCIDAETLCDTIEGLV